jgi:hypothetical protein
MNYKDSTAEVTEPCQYCYGTPSASKFPQFSWGNGTTIAQTTKSTLLNKVSESDHALSTQALPLRRSSGDLNVPQPEDSADQNVCKNQKATFEVAKRFMAAIILTMTSWLILCDDKYWMIENAWKLAIEAQDCQQALEGAAIGMPSVCQFPGGPSMKIELHTSDTVSLGFCFMLLYQILNIDYAKHFTLLKQKISTIQGQFADGVCRSVVRS